MADVPIGDGIVLLPRGDGSCFSPEGRDVQRPPKGRRRDAAVTWRRERRPSKERGGFGEAASLFARTRALLG
ncbi:hypothetical protein [Azospirillum largimobile]